LIVRKLVIRFVIFTRVRGTLSARSVSAIARNAEPVTDTGFLETAKQEVTD
jgi:hypothetical protein